MHKSKQPGWAPLHPRRIDDLVREGEKDRRENSLLRQEADIIQVQQMGFHLMIASSSGAGLVLCFSSACKIPVCDWHVPFAFEEPIPDFLPPHAEFPTLNLKALRRLAIEEALSQTGGNYQQAAMLLGCARASIWEWRGRKFPEKEVA